jgi:GT2 family glycosyltransferase
MVFPMVTVIIVNYNGKKALGRILEECLRSILETVYPTFEVLFVDNASSDDSVAFVKRVFGQNQKLRIIQNDQNFGFAEGNNIGIRNARGIYFVLLNTDTRVAPDWLQELVRSAEPPEVGAVQSKLLQLTSPDLIDSAGGLLDYYGYHRERGFSANASGFNKPAEIFYAKGACVLLKREVLERTGLFDSEMFMYFEEVDLCWRIWLSGYKVVYSPVSLVYHGFGTSIRSNEQKRIYLYYRNHILVLLKNYNFFNTAKSIFVSFMFEARNFTIFLIRRKTSTSIAIAKAFLWNLIHLRSSWLKRQTVQKYVRRVPDEEIMRHLLKPYPPFPLYIVFSKARYFKKFE